ncbi:hypothetical protein C8J57DRAFT_733017 [Mycena rebaudengoi]|nr:hypothetical protein C8J57DRAFT_733017 [Mycena rebaudengoi]
MNAATSPQGQSQQWPILMITYPQEILDAIVDQLKYDKRALAACSRAAAAFTARTRRYLLHTVELQSPRDIELFHELLISSPRVSQFVRELQLDGTNGNDEILVLILNALQRIELLQLFGYLSVMGTPLEGSVFRLLSNQHFKHLVLGTRIITPSFLCSALSACPVLTLGRYFFLTRDPDWNPSLPPTGSLLPGARALQSLIFTFSPFDDAYDILFHPRTLPLLCHLTYLYIIETDHRDFSTQFITLVSPTLETLVLICQLSGGPLSILPALPALRSVVFEIHDAAASRTAEAVRALQGVSPRIEIVVTGYRPRPRISLD